MDASVDRGAPLALSGPGRFTKVAINTTAGEIEARLSEAGNWELHLRKEGEENWRIACRGDLDSGAFTAEPARREALVRGPLVVEPEARTARVGDIILKLAHKEFALLVALAAKPDRVFSKEELLSAIWDYTGNEPSRRVDYLASKVRGKLRAAGADGMIINSWGVGYRLWDRPDVAALPPLRPVGAAA
jgi:DNA-binding response OmpR family regulator